MYIGVDINCARASFMYKSPPLCLPHLAPPLCLSCTAADLGVGVGPTTAGVGPTPAGVDPTTAGVGPTSAGVDPTMADGVPALRQCHNTSSPSPPLAIIAIFLSAASLVKFLSLLYIHLQSISHTSC